MSPAKLMLPLEEEYKKKTLITPEDIAKFRDWLRTQPHLPEKYITDMDLILAYHCSNRSIGVAKQVLDLNYTLRTLFTGIFKNRVYTDKTEFILNNFLFVSLPMRNVNGDKIFFFHFINHDVKAFIFNEVIKALLMIVELWQYREGTWPGMQLVIDLSGMTLGHISKLDLQTMQQYLYYLQEGILLKLAGYHFINAPSFMDKILAIMKPFLKKELIDILRIHPTGSDTLKDFIPIEALPKECGGNHKSINECKDEVLSIMKENKDFFDEEVKKRVNESLRQGKAKTISDIFDGVEGSFKKLEVD